MCKDGKHVSKDDRQCMFRSGWADHCNACQSPDGVETALGAELMHGREKRCSSLRWRGIEELPVCPVLHYCLQQ